MLFPFFSSYTYLYFTLSIIFTYFRYYDICNIKITSQCKVLTVPEDGWFGQPKYSTPTKNHSTLCRILLLFSSSKKRNPFETLHFRFNFLHPTRTKVKFPTLGWPYVAKFPTLREQKGNAFEFNDGNEQAQVKAKSRNRNDSKIKYPADKGNDYVFLIEKDHLGDWSPEKGLLFLTDVSTTCAEAIFRVKWWC